MRPKGTTLLETVLYIGIFMILLPTFVLFILQLWQTDVSLDARGRMEQTASTVFLELQNSLTESTTINVTGSTFGNDNGVLKFTNTAGQLVTIDRPTVPITFGEITQDVHRLRWQEGTDPAIYITDQEVDVTKWRIDAVRSGSTLTGLRISYDTAVTNLNVNAYRKTSFAANTTFSLSGQTIEN